MCPHRRGDAKPGDVGIIVMEDSLDSAATVAKNVPVECAVVTGRPGDIIVADDQLATPPQRLGGAGRAAGPGRGRGF